jgi:hypothetical protein
LSVSEALKALHAPKDRDTLDRGRHRLVFDEFLLLQLGLLRRRQALRSRPGPELSLLPSSQGLVQDFKDLLSFQFTEAQQRVLQEIEGDLSQSKPMARLVQGDVGSGKTVVAIAALLSTIALDETSHGFGLRQISFNFLQHPLLSLCELKRQQVFEILNKSLTRGEKAELRTRTGAQRLATPQQAQLQQQKFVKHQTMTATIQRVPILRSMKGLQRLRNGQKTKRLSQGLRQRLSPLICKG